MAAETCGSGFELGSREMGVSDSSGQSTFRNQKYDVDISGAVRVGMAPEELNRLAHDREFWNSALKELLTVAPDGDPNQYMVDIKASMAKSKMKFVRVEEFPEKFSQLLIGKYDSVKASEGNDIVLCTQIVWDDHYRQSILKMNVKIRLSTFGKAGKFLLVPKISKALSRGFSQILVRAAPRPKPAPPTATAEQKGL